MHDQCDLRLAPSAAPGSQRLELVRLLVERGGRDDDAFCHACEQSNTAFLELLYEPGFDNMVNHKLDFEDAAGLQWFLDRGVDVDANHCLHHVISRGLTIITMLLDAGADLNRPWDRWDIGRRPLALAAYQLLASRGATPGLDAVDVAVLAVARSESVRLLIERGADLHDCAFDEEGPTPLDCAIWGLPNNHAEDGDYQGTVAALPANR